MAHSAGRAVLVVLLATAVGCVGSSDPVVTPIPEAEQDLCSLAQAYIYAFEEKNKAPESFDELGGHAGGEAGEPAPDGGPDVPNGDGDEDGV